MYAQDCMELERFSHVQVLAKHQYPISPLTVALTKETMRFLSHHFLRNKHNKALCWAIHASSERDSKSCPRVCHVTDSVSEWTFSTGTRERHKKVVLCKCQYTAIKRPSHRKYVVLVKNPKVTLAWVKHLDTAPTTIVPHQPSYYSRISS